MAICRKPGSDDRVGSGLLKVCSMKIQRKSEAGAQLIGKLRSVAILFKSWMLPIVVLLVIFTAVALFTQGHNPLVQRIYTNF
jgi:hypothetical protein